MPASRPAYGIVNAFGGAVSKASKRATRTPVDLAGQVLLIGDLIPAQLVELPGMQAGCASLPGWWSHSIDRRPDRRRSRQLGRPTAPASATGVRNRERS